MNAMMNTTCTNKANKANLMAVLRIRLRRSVSAAINALLRDG